MQLVEARYHPVCARMPDCCGQFHHKHTFMPAGHSTRRLRSPDCLTLETRFVSPRLKKWGNLYDFAI